MLIREVWNWQDEWVNMERRQNYNIFKREIDTTLC